MQGTHFTKRRKLFLSIILAALAVACLFGLAACSSDLTVDDLKKRGFEVEVTYDFQGGTVNNRGYINVLSKKDSRIPAPRPNAGGVGIPAKSGYSFRGFFLAQTDADGNVVKDADGKPVPSDTQWSFDTDKVTDKDITLCAKYWENYKVAVHYGNDLDKVKTVEIARNQAGEQSGALRENNLTEQGYTFVSYHLDRSSVSDATGIIFPYTFDRSVFENSADGLTADIWVKSLDGAYRVVRSSRDLSISDVGENTNYYLLADVDMQDSVYNDQTSSSQLPRTYSGKFIGNGHKISNFTLNMTALDVNCNNFGLFRSLGANAEVRDVTFENVTLNYELSNSAIAAYNIGAIAGQVSSGATVSNVTVTSAGEGHATLDYRVSVGVMASAVNVGADLVFGQAESDADVNNCVASNVDLVASRALVSADEQRMVCVSYSVQNGVVTLGEDAIYAYGEKNSRGEFRNYTIRSCERTAENTYALTRLNGNIYDIVITIDGTELSASITQRQ